MEKEKGLNEDGGCSVDWSWLAGEKIASVRNGLDVLIITFESGLEWQVQARLWKGAPFLSFDPFESPKRPG